MTQPQKNNPLPLNKSKIKQLLALSLSLKNNQTNKELETLFAKLG
jgi:hypothetical protein